MTLKTVPVTGTLYNPDGSVAANVTVTSLLTKVDTDGGVVAPSTVSTTTNSSGVFTLNLWPNSRGVNGSQHLVRAQLPGALPGVLLLQLLITVPDSDPAVPVPIANITNRTLPSALSDSKAAMLAAQAFALQAINAAQGATVVAADIANVNAVAGILANINSVAGDLANVNAVAGDLPALDTAVTNMAAIQAAPTQAAAADTARIAAEAARDVILGSQITGTVGFVTFAAMTLAFAAGTVALVAADPDPTKNTWYVKTGASGAGAWTPGSSFVMAALTASSLTIGPDTISTQQVAGYLRAVVDTYGRIAHGVQLDGTEYVDKLSSRQLTAAAATVTSLAATSFLQGLITASAQTFSNKVRAVTDTYGRLAYWEQDDGSVGISKLRDGAGELVYPVITAAKTTADAALAAASTGGASLVKQAMLSAFAKGFYPRAMAGVTVTVGVAGAGSSIVSGTLLAASAGKYRFLFGAAAQAGLVFPDTVSYKWISAWYGGTYFSANGAALEFDHTGQVFEFRMYGKANNNWCRLLVDTKDGTGYRNAGDFNIPNNTGSEYYVRVDLGSSAARRVRLETSAHYFAGVRITNGDTIAYPNDADPPRWVMLGDSFVEGSGTSYASGSLALVMGRALGLDMWASGVGSTGVTNAGGLNPSGQQKVNYQDRLTSDVINVPNLAGLMIWQSVNDSADAQATQLAGLENIVNTVRAAKPTLPICIIGATWTNGSVPQNMYRIRDAGAQAAAELRCSFIDQLNPPQLVGTGNSGAPSGSGNSDLYTTTDGTHPTQAGHDYRGLWLARQFKQTILQDSLL